MSKINDLNESEIKNAVLNNEGDILCPVCEKRLAIVTDYGMIRNCKECGENKQDYNVMVVIDEPSGRRSY